ncbi:D-serine ammonia-lyase [Amphritea balenae]|uniref:Probable D-serine dehydratase n=1 Tax=Amphritea balenae TaxID=452629 RepID=A0A3P1SW37_9GAMM|nr:D-serine ammonia-lyase [Amphritea balenae]RRD01414.1 D-serine ammonia-lyase [Amphritea balenae]GGK57311.1 D-serine ammonia-lyase [Amphritea balenae]
MTATIDTPLGQQLQQAQPFLWLNPAYKASTDNDRDGLSITDIRQADLRLRRFAPLLKRLFPELEASDGIIESALLSAPALQQHSFPELPGRLKIKADHSLPVAGSIKARGGIHEVLCHAEQLALDNNLIDSTSDDYLKFGHPAAKQLFSNYEIAVSSTGNLGLSIGIISAALGFKVVVHMSVEAKQWKKERLRNRGVTVIEHSDDYSAAVAAGRAASDADPNSYFIDDENSPRLFLGYAAAALRLQEQLAEQQIIVDAEHPLFVYIPCGVGGAPGGINFGLKQVFGPDVHVFFAEPVQAPCVLLGMQANDKEHPESVYDVGLKVATEADGLAVSMASGWVCSVIEPMLSGIFTVTDNELFRNLSDLFQSEGLEVEPSAAAGFSGLHQLINTDSGKQYLQQQHLDTVINQATHLVWTTGGLFVPAQEMKKFQQRGAELAGL